MLDGIIKYRVKFIQVGWDSWYASLQLEYLSWDFVNSFHLLKMNFNSRRNPAATFEVKSNFEREIVLRDHESEAKGGFKQTLKEPYCNTHREK